MNWRCNSASFDDIYDRGIKNYRIQSNDKYHFLPPDGCIYFSLPQSRRESWGWSLESNATLLDAILATDWVFREWILKKGLSPHLAHFPCESSQVRNCKIRLHQNRFQSHFGWRCHVMGECTPGLACRMSIQGPRPKDHSKMRHPESVSLSSSRSTSSKHLPAHFSVTKIRNEYTCM